MNVTLYQMQAFNRWQSQAAAKKAQQERQAAIMAVMKKPAQQLRLV
jgi:hypothetical protein